MNKDDAIEAANMLKNYCSMMEECIDCVFDESNNGKYLFCQEGGIIPCNWKIPSVNSKKHDSDNRYTTAERIAELHRAIELRDRRLDEQLRQIAIKDEIIRKQGLQLAELRAKEFVWHGPEEKPEKDGWYLCAAAVSVEPEKGPCIYTPLFYSNASWPVPFTEHFCFMAWAEIPVYEAKGI